MSSVFGAFDDQFCKLVIKVLAFWRDLVYNGSMNNKTTPSLSAGKIKSVGISADTHARIKALSERDGLPIYELVSQAVDAYEWRANALASYKVANHDA